MGEFNRERITQYLESLARETLRNGEIWRAAYTEEYSSAGKLIKKWMSEAGFSVHEDSIGNIFGRIEGRDNKTVMTGSHLDTVKNGGIYDGAAGIITAITAAELLLREKGKPRKSIEVVALIEEEGSRFASSYIGSRGITGKLNPKDLKEKDCEGVTLYDAMKAAGYSPESFEKAKRNDLEAFIELHVEQGPRLEKEGKKIGVVRSIVGIYSYDIIISGEQNHAGTTPMNMRKDPVLAAAHFISEISKFSEECSDTATATFGSIKAEPGMSNVIAKSASLSLDFRDGSSSTMKSIEQKFLEEVDNLINKGFDVKVVKRCDEEPVDLAPEIISIIKESAEEKGFEYIQMNSGAGHDSQIFADFVPTGMIFIPSCKGISHSPKEYTSSGDLDVGAEILGEALYKLSY